jgi:hypothetical protein
LRKRKQAGRSKSTKNIENSLRQGLVEQRIDAGHVLDVLGRGKRQVDEDAVTACSGDANLSIGSQPLLAFKVFSNQLAQYLNFT